MVLVLCHPRVPIYSHNIIGYHKAVTCSSVMSRHVTMPLIFNSQFHQRVESNIITLQYIYILIVSSSISIGYGHVYEMLMNMNMYNQQRRWVVGPWRPQCVCPCENEHCYRLRPFGNVVNLQEAIGIWGISYAHIGYACLECLPWDIQVVPVCVCHCFNVKFKRFNVNFKAVYSAIFKFGGEEFFWLGAIHAV